MCRCIISPKIKMQTQNFAENQEADALFVEKPGNNTRQMHNFTETQEAQAFFHQKSRVRCIISRKNKRQMLYFTKKQE
jgi:hypothetical protein